MIKQIDELIIKYGKMNYLLLTEQKNHQKKSIDYRLIDRERKMIGTILLDLNKINQEILDERIVKEILNLKVNEIKTLSIDSTIMKISEIFYQYTNSDSSIQLTKEQMIAFFKIK